MKILIFGGTTEGRVLARELCADGHAVTVSCATALGVEELRGLPCETLCGRLDTAQIAELVRGFDLVIDATHPYAVEITANVRAACEQAAVPLKRVLRERGPASDCVQVHSCEEAAEVLRGTEGNILLTTGAKELGKFAGLDPERLYVRVLPTHPGIDACEAIGLPHSHIIAMQGPFSEEMNLAVIRQYGIRVLVTKNSGTAGGFAEKISAAEKDGSRVIIIEPPEDSGMSMEELLREVRK